MKRWVMLLLVCASATCLAGPKPNFVILFADDLGYGDVQSFGHPYIRTPHIDQLAEDGQRWTDFYVAAPVCSPSRAALLTGRLPVRTGQYGQRIGVYFPNEVGGFPAEETTIAEVLTDVGYRTGIFGKWHLGDAPHAWPTRHGFDEWLGLPYSNDMDWVGEPDIDEIVSYSIAGETEKLAASMAGRPAKYANPKPEYWAPPLFKGVRKISGAGEGEGEGEGQGEYVYLDETVERSAHQASLTRRYTEAAIKFMERSQAQNQPFFVYLPYAMPHTPLFRSKEFEGKSLGGRYGDVVEEIDWSVGQIRSAIERMGLADNTLVIFTSDNGPWLTMNTEGGRAGLLRHGKGTTFEGGMRVPTAFWFGERLHKGVVSDIGSTLDLYRTFAALAGADGAGGVDGKDLSATLLEGRPSPRTTIAYYRQGELRAYRSGPWKLHFITEGAYRQPPERTEHEIPQLYNLSIDPSERFNVSAQQPQVLKSLLEEVSEHRRNVPVKPGVYDARVVKLMQ
ncbi:MAG: sulfatase [Pseudomonadota bacterium]